MYRAERIFYILPFIYCFCIIVTEKYSTDVIGLVLFSFFF